MASQMSPAVYDAVTADINNGKYLFRATGSKMKFDGFLRVYSQNKEDDRLLPQLTEGEELAADDVRGEQSFTQPPARFTEASLVKILEEKDIGRPSTYAPIVATLLARKYISREKKTLVPTELGFIVTDMLQVELAQLQYIMPRIAGFDKSLSRQAGGIGTRGPGETQLETDRRHYIRRMDSIRNELKRIKRTRKTTRHRRDNSEIPVVALVGYTNAGKSSLMNRMLAEADRSNKDVHVEDMLFATLDTEQRRIKLSGTHARRIRPRVS